MKYSRRVDNLHVAVLVLPLNLLGRREDMRVVITKLQESFKTSTRVLRTLTIETVGEADDQTGPLQPLLLTTGNELVDDTLCVVSKVTELSFPDGQRVGGDEGVTELETEGTEFRQG